MSEVWYRVATDGRGPHPLIKGARFERSTRLTLYYGKHAQHSGIMTEPKTSDRWRWFPSREEAVRYLRTSAIRRLESAENELSRAQQHRERVRTYAAQEKTRVLA